MAVRNIATTDTLETFRTEFNALAANDMGDIANLSGSISATNLVDAMNETISIATSTAGFTIRDASSTTQLIGGGDVLSILGTSNEIETTVSATDTVTIGLPSDVSVTTSLTAPTLTGGSIQLTNNTITATDSTDISFSAENLSTTGTFSAGAITGTSITGSGSTHTLGTIEISGNVIRSTDSTEIQINDGLQVVSPLRAGVTTINPAGSSNITSTTGFTVFGSTIVLAQNQVLAFEGSTDDGFETTLTVVDPTADNVLSLPDNTGTIISTGSTDAVTEAMMANDAIGQNELKSVVTLQILNSSGTPLKTLYGAGA